MKKPTQSFLFVLLLLGGFSLQHNATQAMLSPADGFDEAPKGFDRLHTWFLSLIHHDAAQPENEAPLDFNEHGYTDLHRAAIKCNINRVKQLLEEGVVVDARDAHGRTALHYAVMEKCIANEDKRYDMIRLLLVHEANPMLQDMDGKTALHHIYTPGHEAFDQNEGIKELLGTYKQRAPGFYRMIEKPLSKPSFFNTFAEIRRKRYAQQWFEITKLLTAEIFLRVAQRLDALSTPFPAEIGKLINSYDTPLDIQDNDGNTVLILAARHGDAAIVRLLVAAGATIEIKNDAGNDVFGEIEQALLDPEEKAVVLAALNTPVLERVKRLEGV
ncbi:MAG: ankyrin repeat domain-containing protein [Candidatus Babeliales bacterium]|jgi:hypothetical protein